jgi:hypothetical protein
VDIFWDRVDAGLVGVRTQETAHNTNPAGGTRWLMVATAPKHKDILSVARKKLCEPRIYFSENSIKSPSPSTPLPPVSCVEATATRETRLCAVGTACRQISLFLSLSPRPGPWSTIVEAEGPVWRERGG